MKQYLKLELLLEIPGDLEIELIKPSSVQVDRDITVEPDKKMTMSVEEVSGLIGVGKTTIYAMVRQNEIPHKKVRGKILFHRPTIEKWLITDTNGGEPE